MSNNLPIGADNDVNAPWNQVTDLCRYCDRDIIEGMALENVETTNWGYEEILEAMLEESTLCRDCFKEEQADDEDDWINWRD